MTFRGIPKDGLDFYLALEANNTRSFWQDNKDRYVASVKEPMQALADDLHEYGPFHMFRPYNDVRFAKNKPPYKTAQGAYGESEGGAGYYMQLSTGGLMVGAGYYSMAKDQLARFREMVDADATGSELQSLVTAAERKGYRMGAISELATAPRGYPKDHPRIELLRRKGLIGTKEFGAPAWLHTTRAATKVRAAWSDLADLCMWLDAHVGPSTEPPGDRMF